MNFIKILKILKIIRLIWVGLFLSAIGIVIILSFLPIFTGMRGAVLILFVFGILTFPVGIIFPAVLYFFGAAISIAVLLVGYYIQWFLLPKVIYNIYSILFAKGKRQGAIVINKKR